MHTVQSHDSTPKIGFLIGSLDREIGTEEKDFSKGGSAVNLQVGQGRYA